MTDIPSSGPLAFLLELDKLKEVWRKNRVHGTEREENSAEHSWHASVAALALAPLMPREVDAHRVALLMMVHDLGEIDTGDVLVYIKDETKGAREEAACVDRIASILPAGWGDELKALWHEFEDGRTPEAKVARAIDRLLPCLENIAAGGGAWKTHGITFEQSFDRNRAIGESFPSIWDEIRPLLEEVFGRGAKTGSGSSS